MLITSCLYARIVRKMPQKEDKMQWGYWKWSRLYELQKFRDAELPVFEGEWNFLLQQRMS